MTYYQMQERRLIYIKIKVYNKVYKNRSYIIISVKKIMRKIPCIKYITFKYEIVKAQKYPKPIVYMNSKKLYHRKNKTLYPE